MVVPPVLGLDCIEKILSHLPSNECSVLRRRLNLNQQAPIIDGRKPLPVWLLREAPKNLDEEKYGILTVGSIESLRYMNHDRVTERAWFHAIREGRLEVIVALHEIWSKHPMSNDMMHHHSHNCDVAAKFGQLEVLRYLYHDVGCILWEGTCASAARAGRLECLEWLREEGCPWDSTVFCGAAIGSHLQVMKWLRTQGCPWNTWTWNCALAKNDPEVLQWLRDVQCPGSDTDHTYPSVLQFLRDLKSSLLSVEAEFIFPQYLYPT
jgi:hypothetical protein